MKHSRADYNHHDLNLRIPDDEPVFLIRAQDIVSGDAVRAWANLNDLASGDPKLSRLAREHAQLMDAWPKKKAADLPQVTSPSDARPTPREARRRTSRGSPDTNKDQRSSTRPSRERWKRNCDRSLSPLPSGTGSRSEGRVGVTTRLC